MWNSWFVTNKYVILTTWNVIMTTIDECESSEFKEFKEIRGQFFMIDIMD